MINTTDSEISIEKLMAELGRERYLSKVASAKRYDRQTGTVAGRYLLRKGVAKYETALKEWAKNAKKKAGFNHDLAAMLDGFKLPVVAFIVTRAILDSIGRRATLIGVAQQVGRILEEEARFNAIRSENSVVWSDLRKRIKRTRSDAGKKKVIRDVMSKIHLEVEPWDSKDRLRLGLTLVELLSQSTGLVQIQRIARRTGPGDGRRFSINMVVATPETLEWMEKSNEAHEAMFPFWLPSVVPPLDWENPWDGGYHTNLVVRRPLVKSRDKEVQQTMETANLGEVYAAVNTLQHTRWEINPDVYETMLHFWDAGHPIADLPERVDEAPVVRPPEVSTDEAALKMYKMAVSIRHQRIVASRSRRVLASKIMFMAKHFLDLQFYFPHQIDFRGRLYTVPYFLQPQGPSQARGLLRFAEGRAIETEAQASWLAVHGANCFGVDKVSFMERVAWVEANVEKIKRVHQDPIDFTWWAEADKPWEFLAFCLEWAQYLEEGYGFVSKIPVSMDGSNNGLQIFSLLLRDREGAKATNCLPSDTPQDIYQDVADAVTEKLQLSTDPMAVKWLEFTDGRLPRVATKRSVMTLPYGSTFHSCIHYTRDWYEETRKKRGSTPFERGYDPSVFLARLIWDAINTKVSSAKACMTWLREAARVFADLGLPVRWTSPTGFPIKQGYMKYQTRQIKTAVGDSVRWTQYRLDTDDVALRKQVNGISPNFVHSLDAAALVRSINLAHDAGVNSFMMIHDSYGVPAADAPRMAGVLREVYAELFSEDLLAKLRDELTLYLPDGVTLPPLPELGDLDVTEVKQSMYFFA